jgi:hypothetical protein
MVCPWCLRTLDMIKNVCASQADEELLESIVHNALEMLPEHLQEMLECREVECGAEAVTQELNIVLVGSDDPADALVTVKSCQMPARLYSVFCAPGAPRPDDELLEGSYFWSVSIHGRMVGFRDFPGDEVYDVDLQLAVLKILASALCHLGIIDRDDCGRFVDKQRKLVFEWEHGI